MKTKYKNSSFKKKKNFKRIKTKFNNNFKNKIYMYDLYIIIMTLWFFNCYMYFSYSKNSTWKQWNNEDVRYASTEFNLSRRISLALPPSSFVYGIPSFWPLQESFVAYMCELIFVEVGSMVSVLNSSHFYICGIIFSLLTWHIL